MMRSDHSMTNNKYSARSDRVYGTSVPKAESKKMISYAAQRCGSIISSATLNDHGQSRGFHLGLRGLTLPNPFGFQGDEGSCSI